MMKDPQGSVQLDVLTIDRRAAPEASSLDEMVRRIVREEVRSGGRPPLPAPPAPVAKPRAREAMVLVLLIASLGFVLALIPELDDVVKPLWSAATLLGTGALGFGYAWWRDRLHAIARHWATAIGSVVLFVGLLGTHGIRNVPVVPVSVTPSNALVFLDGEGPLADIPTRLTLRSRTVDVKPQKDWELARERKYQMTTRASLMALFNLGPEYSWTLSCLGGVMTDRADAGATIEIAQCDPANATTCSPVALTADSVELLETNPDYRRGGELNAGRLTYHDAARLTEPTLPIGRYYVGIRKSGCASAEKEWILAAPGCAVLTFEKLQCQ